jgi:hypothetical protein
MIEQIIPRIMEIWSVFLIHPKVYFPLIGEWLLVLIYFIISGDTEDLADVYAAGVTLGFVGFELLPFHNITFGDTTVYLSIALMVYGVLLIILAASGSIPGIISRILGMPSAISFPTLLAILYFESAVSIDLLTILIIGAPFLVLEIIKLIRQLTH